MSSLSATAQVNHAIEYSSGTAWIELPTFRFQD
jgi:hypothetical protein